MNDTESSLTTACAGDHRGTTPANYFESSLSVLTNGFGRSTALAALLTSDVIGLAWSWILTSIQSNVEDQLWRSGAPVQIQEMSSKTYFLLSISIRMPIFSDDVRLQYY